MGPQSNMGPQFGQGAVRGIGPPEAFIVLTSTPVEIESTRIGRYEGNHTCTSMRRILL